MNHSEENFVMLFREIRLHSSRVSMRVRSHETGVILSTVLLIYSCGLC